MKHIIVIIGSFIIAFAFSFFLVPHEILSSGLRGIAILIGLITPFDIGILNFVLNIPILIYGYYKLGREITYQTLLCVVFLSLFLSILPIQPIATSTLLSAIFG